MNAYQLATEFFNNIKTLAESKIIVKDSSGFDNFYIEEYHKSGNWFYKPYYVNNSRFVNYIIDKYFDIISNTDTITTEFIDTACMVYNALLERQENANVFSKLAIQSNGFIDEANAVFLNTQYGIYCIFHNHEKFAYKHMTREEFMEHLNKKEYKFDFNYMIENYTKNEYETIISYITTAVNKCVDLADLDKYDVTDEKYIGRFFDSIHHIVCNIFIYKTVNDEINTLKHHIDDYFREWEDAVFYD